MIKLMPSDSGRFHNFKCGEVYCLSTQRYDISCCLCGAKVELVQFPKHFQEHLQCDNLKDSNASTAPISSRTRQKNQTENDPLFPNEELLTIKPEGIDEEEVSAFSWNDNFEPDGITIETPIVESSAPLEDQIERKPEPFVTVDIGDMGSKTDTIFGEDDDEINIGVDSDEWLHEKYSYDEVPSDDDESVDLEELDVTDIKVNLYESNEDSDYNREDFDYVSKKRTVQKIAPDYVAQALPCEYCKRIFNSKIGLKIHTKAMHERNMSPDEKTKAKAEPPQVYACEECGEKFVTERNLVTHKYKHTGIFCDICGKTFSQVGNMERHRIRHTGIKTIKCVECDKAFFTERERKAHMMRHTGILPIICEICGKRCRDHGVLTAHMRRHTGERPAKCNVCGKSFFCGYDLNVHSVTHTTERPFKCEICGSTFQLKKSLRVHKKIHSKDRSHVCQVCGKGFAQSTGLISHMRMHDGATRIDKTTKIFETNDSVDDVADVAAQVSNAAIMDVARYGVQWGLGLL